MIIYIAPRAKNFAAKHGMKGFRVKYNQPIGNMKFFSLKSNHRISKISKNSVKSFSWTNIKVIVTLKLSGCLVLQIGFIDYRLYSYFFLFEPPKSSNSNLKVLCRSQVCPNEGRYIKICYKIQENYKLIRTRCDFKLLNSNNWS